MSQFTDNVNEVECNIEINGGDKIDHTAAENMILELSNTGLSITEIARKVEAHISDCWLDSNGFNVSIYPVHLIDKK